MKLQILREGDFYSFEGRFKLHIRKYLFTEKVVNTGADSLTRGQRPKLVSV